MARAQATVRVEFPQEDVRRLIGHVLDAAAVDEHCWLCGGVNCDVEVMCRTCDRDGQPIAYYPGGIVGKNPYPEAETPTATGIFHLYLLANEHVRAYHLNG